MGFFFKLIWKDADLEQVLCYIYYIVFKQQFREARYYENGKSPQHISPSRREGGKTDNPPKINASVAINDIPKALVNDWYVTGLTDSEGNFSINYNTCQNTNKVTFSYKITQKVDSISVLHDLKAFFNCGNVVIDNKDSKGYKFQVSSLDSIPLFEG